METVIFKKSLKNGAIMTRWEGRVAFPADNGPQPQDGEEWEVIGAKSNPGGNVFFLELGKKILPILFDATITQMVIQNTCDIQVYFEGNKNFKGYKRFATTYVSPEPLPDGEYAVDVYVLGYRTQEWYEVSECTITIKECLRTLKQVEEERQSIVSALAERAKKIQYDALQVCEFLQTDYVPERDLGALAIVYRSEYGVYKLHSGYFSDESRKGDEFTRPHIQRVYDEFIAEYGMILDMLALIHAQFPEVSLQFSLSSGVGNTITIRQDGYSKRFVRISSSDDWGNQGWIIALLTEQIQNMRTIYPNAEQFMEYIKEKFSVFPSFVEIGCNKAKEREYGEIEVILKMGEQGGKYAVYDKNHIWFGYTPYYEEYLACLRYVERVYQLFERHQHANELRASLAEAPLQVTADFPSGHKLSTHETRISAFADLLSLYPPLDVYEVYKSAPRKVGQGVYAQNYYAQYAKGQLTLGLSFTSGGYSPAYLSADERILYPESHDPIKTTLSPIESFPAILRKE